MNEDQKEKKYARPAEPFSSDPEIAGAQLLKMRPSLIHFFQRKNVVSPRDEDLADKTINTVLDSYMKGTKILDRNAYTYEVATNLWRKYIKKELSPGGRQRSIDDLPNPPIQAPTDNIDQRLDNQKKLACVAKCRQKLIDEKKFSEEVVNAFFKYKLLEGHAKEERDRIAQSLNRSRLGFEQAIKDVIKELIKCVGECMNRPQKKAQEIPEDNS